MILTQQLNDTYLKEIANLVTNGTDDEIKAVLEKRSRITNIVYWVSLLMLIRVSDLTTFSTTETFLLMALCMLPSLLFHNMYYNALEYYNRPIEAGTRSARALAAYQAGSSWASDWLSSRNTTVFNYLDLIVSKKLFHSQIKNS